MNLTLCLTLSSEFNPLFNLKVLVNSGSLGLWRRHTLQEDRHTTRGAIVIGLYMARPCRENSFADYFERATRIVDSNTNGIYISLSYIKEVPFVGLYPL